MDITVVGMGYVGIVAAGCLAAAGHRVQGVDIDERRIAALRAGEAPIREPGVVELLRAHQGNLRFTAVGDGDDDLGDAVMVTVGTPQGPSGSVDLSQVQSAMEWTRGRARPGAVVVMKSTVPPGTGEKLIDRHLRDSGLHYASNPEFLREGQAVHDWQHPTRIVIGARGGDHAAVSAVRAMHNGIDCPRFITDINSAEMVKYASNAFLSTRISFINEIAGLCERVGASVDAVSEGMALDPRLGTVIRAGVGYGGSCFPKDVRALDQLAITNGASTELLRAVININNRQRLLPLHALRQRFNGSVAGLRVAVLGLAFKPNTDDVREAPALDLVRSLGDEGARVRVHDPWALDAAAGQLSGDVRACSDLLEATDRAQAVILMTEWADYVNADWLDVSRSMSPPRFLYDGRNALDRAELERLGFHYTGVGRSDGGAGASVLVHDDPAGGANGHA